MRLYIAVVESAKRKGRRVKLAIHTNSKKDARAAIEARFTKWTLRSLSLVSGPHCVAFLDEFPE